MFMCVNIACSICMLSIYVEYICYFSSYLLPPWPELPGSRDISQWDIPGKIKDK